MSIAITDEQAVVVQCSGAPDNMGVPAQMGTLAPSVDNPQYADAYVNPNDPTQVIVAPVPPPAGSPSVRPVNLSVTDTTNNVTTQSPLAISIGPAGETAINLSPTVVPLASVPTPPAPAGGQSAAPGT